MATVHYQKTLGSTLQNIFLPIWIFTIRCYAEASKRYDFKKKQNEEFPFVINNNKRTVCMYVFTYILWYYNYQTVKYPGALDTPLAFEATGGLFCCMN